MPWLTGPTSIYLQARCQVMTPLPEASTLPFSPWTRGTHVRMLFIDCSSAFNTIVPSKLVIKLRGLGLNTALCDWILKFLTAVQIGSTTSSTLTLNTTALQGCVLSPLLYSLFMHDCMATHSSNTIIKFCWRLNRHWPDHRQRWDSV